MGLKSSEEEATAIRRVLYLATRETRERNALEVDEALIDRFRFHKRGAVQLSDVEIARVASVVMALHDRQELSEGESEGLQLPLELMMLSLEAAGLREQRTIH